MKSNSTTFSQVFTKYPKTKFSFPGSKDISLEVTGRIPNAKKEFLKM